MELLKCDKINLKDIENNQQLGVEIGEECLSVGNGDDDWGEKVEKLFYIKEYEVDSGKANELIFKFKFKSDFIGQQAAISLSFAQQTYTLGVGRLYLLESEYNTCLYDKDGNEMKAGLPTYKPDNFFYLKFVISEAFFEVYASNNELDYTCVAYVHKSFGSFDKVKVLLGYKDTNPYDYHIRVKKRELGCNGIAKFYSISNQIAENYESKIAKVYCRITISDTKPQAQKVKCALIGYTSVVLRIAKKYLTDKTSVNIENVLTEGVDYSKITENDTITVGKTTQWLDLSDIFAIPRVQQTLAFSLNTTDRMDMNHGNDAGNIKNAKIKIEFANEKSENSILKTIDSTLDGEVLGVFIDGDLSDLSKWNEQIRTMNEYLSDIIKNYKALGAAKFKKATKYNINAHKKVSYFCNPFDKRSDELFYEIFDLIGANKEMAAYWPPEMPENPWDDNYKERFAKEVASHMVMTPDTDSFYVKVGDEPHILRLEALKSSQEGLAQFKNYVLELYEKQYKGQFELPQQIEPLWIHEVHSVNDAFLHLATIWFLQISTLKQYHVANELIHGYHKGKDISVGTDAYLAGFNVSPDYYLEAEYEAFDTQSHHYGSGDTVSPRQVGSDRYLATMFDCAAKFGNIRRGLLWFICRIGCENGVLLSGMTALMRQISLFHLYGCGPRWTGAEWFVDDKYKSDCYMAVRQIFEIASEYEEDILAKRTYIPKAAVIFSRSACIWAEAPDDKLVGIYGHEGAVDDMKKRHEILEDNSAAVGFGLERKMIFNVLSRNYYLPDIIPEEKVEGEFLKQYDVVYLTDTHLSVAAQEALEEWVKNGGHLFIGTCSGEYDELNRKSSLLNRLTGVEATLKKVDNEARAVVRGMGGEIWTSDINFSEEDAAILKVLETAKTQNGLVLNAYARTESLDCKNRSAELEILASYEDNTPAMIKANIGKGSVYKSAICLGAAYANSATPSFSEFIGVDLYPYDSVISGRTAHYQQDFDDSLSKLLLTPATDKNVYRSIVCSKEGLDINYFENEETDSAIILIANYSKSARSGIKISIDFSKKYSNISLKFQNEFSYSWSFHKLIIETKVDAIQVIHLTNK